MSAIEERCEAPSHVKPIETTRSEASVWRVREREPPLELVSCVGESVLPHSIQLCDPVLVFLG